MLFKIKFILVIFMTSLFLSAVAVGNVSQSNNSQLFCLHFTCNAITNSASGNCKIGMVQIRYGSEKHYYHLSDSMTIAGCYNLSPGESKNVGVTYYNQKNQACAGADYTHSYQANHTSSVVQDQGGQSGGIKYSGPGPNMSPTGKNATFLYFLIDPTPR